MAGLASNLRTVLVVEAYPPSRLALTELLQDAGYRVIAAADAEQAAQLAAASLFPIVAVIAEWDVGEASLRGLGQALERHGGTVELIRLPYAGADVSDVLRRLERRRAAHGTDAMC